MKYIGLILIFLCSIYSGQTFKRRIIKRIESFERIITMIDLIQMQINYLSSDIDELINTLLKESEFKGSSFISGLKRNLCSGLPLDESWQKAAEESFDYLSSEEKSVIISFGNHIGKSDIEGQRKNCAIHKEKINRLLENERKKYEKKGNLYSRLSIIIGIMIDLILL